MGIAASNPNPRDIMLGIRRSAAMQVCQECAMSQGRHTPTCYRGEIIDVGEIEELDGYDRSIRYPTIQVGDVHYNPPCSCGPKDACNECAGIKRREPSGLRQQRWLLG